MSPVSRYASIQRRLAAALDGIDRLSGLDDLVRAGDPAPQGPPDTTAPTRP